MKKVLLLTLGIILLIGMSVRVCRNYIRNFKDEHQWYIRQLNIKFSGVVDTVTNRHILFRITHGDFDRNREGVINEKLKYNGVASLFLYLPDDRAGLMIDSAFQYHKGDSLYLNTDLSYIRIYRNHQFLSEKN